MELGRSVIGFEPDGFVHSFPHCLCLGKQFTAVVARLNALEMQIKGKLIPVKSKKEEEGKEEEKEAKSKTEEETRQYEELCLKNIERYRPLLIYTQADFFKQQQKYE